MISSEEAIEGDARKGAMKLAVLVLPMVISLLTIAFSVPTGLASARDAFLILPIALLLIYVPIFAYIAVNPRWVWDIQYLKLVTRG